MERGLHSFFRDLTQADHEVLDRQEEKELAERVRAGDQGAKEKLVEHNLRLVVHIADGYRYMGVEFSDLIQEGSLGLLIATEKFDPELGYKFSTYAYWWIRQRIIRTLDQKSRTVRVPSYVSGLKRKVNQLARTYRDSQGRKPTVEELAEELDTSQQNIRRAIRTKTWTTSLDKPLQEDGVGATLAEVIEEEASSPKQEAEAELAGPKLDRLMEEELTDRERRIVKLRYGLEDYQPRTLDEVGKVFDLSRERIRQLQNRALDKLRSSERARELARHV
ncbi:MAG: sigma-70 family RNA polymerase sigma factor [Candidatus Bipolaricaulota bacterium]